MVDRVKAAVDAKTDPDFVIMARTDAAAPKHLLGIGEPDDLLAGIALGIDVDRVGVKATTTEKLPIATRPFDSIPSTPSHFIVAA